MEKSKGLSFGMTMDGIVIEGIMHTAPKNKNLFNAADTTISEFASLTPYQYGANNPVYYNDPTGAVLGDLYGGHQDRSMLYHVDGGPGMGGYGSYSGRTNNPGGTYEDRVIKNALLGAGFVKKNGKIGYYSDKLNVSYDIDDGYWEEIGDLGEEYAYYLMNLAPMTFSSDFITLLDFNNPMDVRDRRGVASNGGDQQSGGGFDLSGQDILSYSLSAGGFSLLLNDEFRAGSSGRFSHVSGKVYSSKFYGNQYISRYTVQASKLNTTATTKFLAKVSNRLAFAGAALTLIDGVTDPNGWQNHHTADLVVSGALYGLAAFGPVGWIAAGTYLAVDIGFQYYTGKSITENIFD